MVHICLNLVDFYKAHHIGNLQTTMTRQEQFTTPVCCQLYMAYLTKQALNKLAAAQTKMEIRVCSISHSTVSLELLSFYVGNFVI